MTGLIYPLTLNSFGNFPIGSGEDLIKSAIAVTLLTPIGSRPVLKDFGSKLFRLRYMNSEDPALRALTVAYTVEAIETWIPEVEIADIQVIIRPGDLTMDLSFIPPDKDELQFFSVIFPNGG